MTPQGKERRLRRAVTVLGMRQGRAIAEFEECACRALEPAPSRGRSAGRDGLLQSRALDARSAQAPGDLAELYRELADRMWLALAEVKARARTKDEEAGHAFHGNQWTGGLGAKPKTTTAKTSKAAVHELLSSGHPFTKQELMDIAGIKTEKLFSDYMAMLKNPKYAGPKGALQIAHKDGHYYVAMPNGQPAPPLLVDKHGAIEDPGIAQAPAKAPKEPTPAEKAVAAPAPAPAEPEAQKPAPSDPFSQGVEALKAAAPGSLMKGEADKHYNQAMAGANAYLKTKVLQAKAFPNPMPKAADAVLEWKKKKAEAMAAWATAVHGAPFVPKEQALFKADQHLAKVLVDGAEPAEAIAQWKSWTGLEKAGLFDPSKPAGPIMPPEHDGVEGVQEPVVTEGKPSADMGHAAPVQPLDYHSLVPAGHQHVGPDDFAEDNGKWAKGIAKIKHELSKQGGINAQDNKKSVESKLRERLKDAPNFQALVKRLGLAKSGHASLESRLIAAWAGSSGDTHDISVALQMAVRDAFGIPDSHIEKAALNSLNVHGHDVDKLTKAAIQDLNGNIKPLQAHEVQTARAALQEFVQAQYHETQAMLQELGHEHVYLARGMKFKTAHQNAHGPANVKLQPASSFSTNFTTASNFSGMGGTVFLVRVPRQQVLSTYLTGFGCTGEHEVVVLAHKDLKAYTVPSGMGSTVGASSKVHADIHGKAQQQAVQPPAPSKPAAKKPAGPKPANPALQKASQEFIKSALTQDPAAHHAALKKAVINAKSKALKAKVAAEKKFPGNLAKAEHAKKAAEEAKAAVEALQAFLKGSKK